MKKLISLILACLIAFACATALGGCGKSNAETKQAFIGSRSYYSDLVESLAAPVAKIDGDALADGAASGMSGRIRLNASGLSAFSALLGDIGDTLGLAVSVVTDGVSASGDFSLEMLGETLNALFSTDGGDVVLSLPDLLDRPVKLSQSDFAGTGFGDDFDFDAYEEEHGIIDLDEDAYEADYDFDENGKFFAENGDLYVDADGDGKLDIAYYAGKYDEDFVDSMIRNTREFYESLGDDFDVDDGWTLAYDEDGNPYYVYEGDDDFDLDGDGDFDVDDDFDIDGDFDADDGFDFDFGEDDFGSTPFAPDFSYVSLIARYAEPFLNNVADGCFTRGREKFRTAGGEAELDCLTLSADGNDLYDALKKTAAQIADDPELDGIAGEHADDMREYFREFANEETSKEQRDYNKNVKLTWKRFTKDEKIIGERVSLDHPEARYTLEAGVDGGESGVLAFMKITDDKKGVDLFDAESSVGSKKSKLDLRVIANGVPYTLSVSGKTTEHDGAAVTKADVKVGIGGLTFKLFELTTTVRAFTSDEIGIDAELSVSLPKLLVGSDVDLALYCSVDMRRDPGAKPEMIDATGAYTGEDLRSEEFNATLNAAIKEKLPKIYGYFESRQNAPATDESDA
jgi:hypothetical protein